MQFYENGFDFGQRRWTYALPQDLEVQNQPSLDLPSEVDVLVVGTGPAGLLLAAQLSRFPDIKTCVIEAKPGRLQLGQADGLQCRTLEIFEAFGFSERILREAYYVNEVTFWAPDQDGLLVRTGRTKDTKEGLSEFPHVILNQSRVHDFFLDEMFKAPKALRPFYSKSLVGLRRISTDRKQPGVEATVELCDEQHKGRTAQVKARYVVGADGARSNVRKCMGLSLHGDSANHAWGVMDVLVDTDFPDIRFKSAIKSKIDGTVILIPREGGYLVRLYVEMGDLEPGERLASRHVTYDDVVAKAQKIFSPFKLEVKECPWWSVYEIGQRVADRFDDGPTAEEPDRVPSVFIMGDACHTHSPKAGQGMNVSMSDAFNLGWKLATVIRGSAQPSLLSTYSEERQAIAKELIEYDRTWSSALAQHAQEEEHCSNGINQKLRAEKEANVQKMYEEGGLFVSGLGTRYPTSSIVADSSKCRQDLAKGYPIGRRFKSCEVLRCFDAHVIHLAHTFKADGKWRMLIFDPDSNPAAKTSRATKLCEWLTNDSKSPVVKATPSDAELDSVIDVRAIFKVDHHQLDVNHVPEILRPRKGRYGLKDHEKVFCDRWDGGAAIPSIYREREIDTTEGCIVVVRPDQYVSAVWSLEDFESITSFFDQILVAT